MKNSSLLPTITILIGLVTLTCLKWEVLPNGWLRALTGTIFLIFAFRIVSFKKYLGLITIGLFVLCDIFLIFWETNFSKHSYYAFHSLAVLIMLFLTVRELKRPQISALEGTALAVFFLIISGILVFLGNFFEAGIADPFLKILFYLNGFLIVLLVMAAFFYSTNYANDISAFFFLSVIGLAISDLILFAIYVLDFEEYRYVDNLFYVFGLYFLLRSYQRYRILKAGNSEIDESLAEKADTDEKTDNPKVYR